MEYKGARYVPLKKGGHGKGSVIIYYNGDAKLVPGYPSIKRLVLLSKVPEYFPEGVSVEEKMNGYNVRTVLVGGELFAVTRGGYLCPYTNARLREEVGEELKELLKALPPGSVVAGEIVGTENPYVRVEYPEEPRFGYFIFDIFVRDGKEWKQMPVHERHELVKSYGLRSVKLLGTFKPEEAPQKIKEIIDKFDVEGREGVVMKDPNYRREPAKYTGSFTNIGDIEQGMLYPFDEGKDYLFPRIVREMFKVYEEGLEGRAFEERALWLGKAILSPSVRAVKAVAEGKPIHEEFTLRFPTEEDLEEYLRYVRTLGIKVSILEKENEDGWTIVRVRKYKRSPDVIEGMLKSGHTPLD